MRYFRASKILTFLIALFVFANPGVVTANLAPEAIIPTPPNNAVIQASSFIYFPGVCFDPDGEFGDEIQPVWDFGDGTGDSGKEDPTHAYAAAGTYTVTLTCTDAGGLSNTATITLTITPPPVARITAPRSFVPLLVGRPAAFAGLFDSDSAPIRYFWSFGDGTSSSEQNPTHTYATPGTYTVVLTAMDDNDFMDQVQARYFVFADGGVVADPHFLSWSGGSYDFMGACDMHLVTAPNFAPSLELTIDIRTKIRYEYSFIESAVVKIGEDTLEVDSLGEFFINGVNGGLETLEAAKISGFPIKHEQVNKKEHLFEIQVAENEKLLLKAFKDMVSVKIHNADTTRFHGSEGMMGEFETGKLLARDGKTVVKDPNALAAEWQVKDDEPMLFQAVSGPQYPERCILPDPNKKEGRRLGLGQSIARKTAQEACAKWTENKEGCIHDVMATGDLDLASSGLF